jgi:calcineurin-like phosphoesterase family protein
MGKIFLIGDTHFNHANIIKYCNRPFSSAKEMDEVMINNWNSVVKSSDDIVYHVGDFAFGDFRPYFECLNGTIHLLKGNHDKKDDYHKYFASVGYYAEIKLDSGLRICCQHFAMRVWNHSHFGNYHCYGHSHGTLPGLGKSMDVGVDTHDFYPYEISEVVSLLENQEIVNPVTKEDVDKRLENE